MFLQLSIPTLNFLDSVVIETVWCCMYFISTKHILFPNDKKEFKIFLNYQYAPKIIVQDPIPNLRWPYSSDSNFWKMYILVDIFNCLP